MQTSRKNIWSNRISVTVGKNMQIKWETILDAFTYNGKILVCQIRFVTKIGNNFTRISGNRCMLNSQQWQAFDEKLADIVKKKNLDGHWSHEGYSFQLCDGDLNVNVNKTNISSQALCECLCLGELSANDIAWMLECRIERQISEYQPARTSKGDGGIAAPANAYVPSKSNKTKSKHLKHLASRVGCASEFAENSIYSPKPLPNTSSSNGKLESKTPVPEYQPAPIKIRTSIGDNQSSIKKYIIRKPTAAEKQSIKTNDEAEYVPSKIVPLQAVSEDVPEYVPTPINTNCLEQINSGINLKHNGNTTSFVKADEVNSTLGKEKAHHKSKSKNIPGGISSKENSHHKCRTEKPKNHSKHDHKSTAPAYSLTTNKKRDEKPDKATNSKRTCSLHGVKDHCHQIKSKEHLKYPTSSKAHHLAVNEIDKGEYKSKSSKQMDIKRIHRELFGSDDNDDEPGSVIVFCSSRSSTTPHAVNKNEKKSSPHIVSTPRISKKVRKRQLEENCDQEKRSINKWLNQMEPTKSMRVTSIENSFQKRMQQFTSVMCDPTPLNNSMDNLEIPPKKIIKYLSLKHLREDQVQNTFDACKPYLDAIYQKYHTTHYVKDHDGIDHCFVINLINENLQRKMLNKLSDVYFSRTDTSHATMYVNAMLPEWIIRIFMKTYKFSREEAIHHVKCQHAYKLYEESLLDKSFESTI